MTFEHYWGIVVKRWRLILLCFVVVGLGTFIVSKLMTPVYESTAVVQIDIRSGSSQADYNSLLASDELVQTEAQLAVSGPVLREVTSQFRGLTMGQLTAEATSTTELNTQLFEITVLDPSPRRAADLANAIATTLIKQQLQAVEQQDSQSQQQIQQDLNTTQQAIDGITHRIANLQSRGGNQAELQVQQAELSGLQQQYIQWQSALAQLELTQAQNINFLRVAQPAQPGLSPVKPNVLLNSSAGLLAGLFLGMLLAVLVEELDTRVRTPEALTTLLDWSVLGTIWRTPPAAKDELINPKGHNANIESYRILRTNVGFSGIDKPLHSFMVTSPMPGDGKSTIAANLAIFMAKAGKNTLLIDADLRRPTQHQLFGLTAEKKGLSNAIMGFSMPTVANAASPVPSSQFLVPVSPARSTNSPNTSNYSLEPFMHAVGVPNLRVMPSGPLPPNPSELLDSKAMQRLFAAFASCGAEVVIFDVPPIRGLSDASILASKVDGTLVVIDVSRATKGHLKQTKTLLAQAGAHVLGCVVNKQRRSRNDTSYSYYYYYRHADQHGEGKARENVGAERVPEAAHVGDTARKRARVSLGNVRKGGS